MRNVSSCDIRLNVLIAEQSEIQELEQKQQQGKAEVDAYRKSHQQQGQYGAIPPLARSVTVPLGQQPPKANLENEQPGCFPSRSGYQPPQHGYHQGYYQTQPSSQPPVHDLVRNPYVPQSYPREIPALQTVSQSDGVQYPAPRAPQSSPYSVLESSISSAPRTTSHPVGPISREKRS